MYFGYVCNFEILFLYFMLDIIVLSILLLLFYHASMQFLTLRHHNYVSSGIIILQVSVLAKLV